MDRMRYFAYGSNLDAAQMGRRCPSMRIVCRATLAEHRLVFPLGCTSWGGGVAGIEPHPAHRVEGVVYDINADDLAALDLYENIAGGDYRRQTVRVRLDTREHATVWTYYANPAPEGPTAPSRRYLDTILRGARAHGLSEAYIAQLCTIPTCDAAAALRD